MAELAAEALAGGIRKLIVAGGETSGAVTRRLGYSRFLIGGRRRTRSAGDVSGGAAGREHSPEIRQLWG